MAQSVPNEEAPTAVASTIPAYAYTDSPEPHAVRRRAILQQHPEIRGLYGWDRAQILPMVAACGAQIALAVWVAGWSMQWTNVLLAVALALFVGSVLSHLCSMFMHEAAHNNCAPTSGENRAWAILANTCQGVPGAMTFRKYHLRHHANLGVFGVDADLPADWEVRHLPQTRWSKALWLFFLFGFWVARGWERRTPPNRYEVLNAVWIIAVNAVLLAAVGPVSVGWLLLSTLIGHSFHPVAAHFIHEHYVFEEGQETYSYYGVLNRVTFNVGYHVEHHDFPSVPGSKLPTLHAIAPAYYTTLLSHRSWTFVLLDFVWSSRMGWNRRIVRGRRAGGPWSQAPNLPAPALLAGLGHTDV